MRTVALIQARTSSVRLPGKVLLDLNGHPLLWHVINRTRQAKTLDGVVVATTVDIEDKAICKLAESMSVPYFRGSRDDVLGRLYGCAKEHKADVIARITGDCPMIDPLTVDAVIDLLKTQGAEYASNIIPFDNSQDGTDVEAFAFALLEHCHRWAITTADREHVTLWMRRNSAKQALYTGGPRNLLSVDTLEDLERVRQMLESSDV